MGAKYFLRTILVLLFAAVFVTSEEGSSKYTDKFDNMNVDEILSNKRLLNNYINCLLDAGRCSPDGTELKKVLPEALKTGCQKCTDVQKTLGEKILKHIFQKEPEAFGKLESKYDPEGTFRLQIQEKLGNRQ